MTERAARFDADASTVESDAALRLARDAAAAGVSPVLIGVLVDPASPPAARDRAYGRIAAILLGARP